MVFAGQRVPQAAKLAGSPQLLYGGDCTRPGKSGCGGEANARQHSCVLLQGHV